MPTTSRSSLTLAALLLATGWAGSEFFHALVDLAVPRVRLIVYVPPLVTPADDSPAPAISIDIPDMREAVPAVPHDDEFEIPSHFDAIPSKSPPF